MKNSSHFAFLLLLAIVSLASCGEKGNWTPGPKVDPNSVKAYFEPATGQVDPEEEFLALTLSRVVTTEAVTVPIVVVSAAPELSFPAKSVTFAAGEKNATFRVDFSADTKWEVDYPMVLKVDDSHADPYIVDGNYMFSGSLRRLEPWVYVADMTCTYEARSGSKPAKFDPFIQKLYKKEIAGNQFMIENWCLNNTGEKWGNFAFRVDENNQIHPDPSVGWHGTKGRWYFHVPWATAEEPVEEWQIEGYLPNTEGVHMTYYYLYTVGSTDSRFKMDFNEAEKTACFGGYTRFNKSTFSSGAFYLHYTW
jgi:predicted small lipoprotein YifL